MKEKLLRTKKELEKEYSLNSKEIRKLKEKIKILNSNLIEGKFYLFAMGTAVSLPILMFLSIFIAYISPSILVSIIGTNTFNIIRFLFAGSFVLGFVEERIISKINHRKLNRFSNAKSDEQKREEILGYQLEKQKLEDKNMAISKAYDFASDLETKVDVCNVDFGNSKMSKEEQGNNNKELRNNINNKERELEISSTQLFLNENFVMLRSKLGKIATIGIPVGVGLLSYLFVSAGSLIINPLLLTNPAFNTIGLIGGGIGAITSIIPTYFRNKQNRRLFNKINNKLGENKLPQNTDNDIIEKRKIVSKGDKIIEELATAHLIYQDSTRELERMQKEEFINKGVESDYKKEKVEEVCQIIEELMDNNEGIYNKNNNESVFDTVLRELNKIDDNLDLRGELEDKKEVEGPTLVKGK